jgi:hypothetical protein
VIPGDGGPPADDPTAGEDAGQGQDIALPDQNDLVPIYAEFGAAVHDTHGDAL